MANADYLSCSEAAQIMGVSRSSVQRYCEQGELRSHTTLGGHRRINASEVTRWLSGKQSKSRKRKSTCLKAERYTPGYVADVLLSGKLRKIAPVLESVALKKDNVAWLVDHFLAPAMWEVGNRWACGKINYADERRATTNLKLLYRQIACAVKPNPNAFTAIGATLEGDQSDLGSAALELVAQELGINAYHVGTNLPVETFAEIARQMNAEVVWVSYCHIENPEVALAMNQKLRELLPPETLLTIGGRALNADLKATLDHDFFGASCSEFREFLGSLHAKAA